jgi:ABC-type sugar transport system permease subunit
MLRTRFWVPYLYVAPAIALLALVFAYPVVRVVDFSTRLIRGASGPYVGSLNYQLVWEDSTFRDALRHSAMLLLAVPVLLALAIFFAVLLYERARGWKIYRSVLFLPYILAVPIVGIVASYIFALNGALNSILRAVGLNGLAFDWLGSERLSLLTVGIVIVWRELGFGILLFLARLLSMNEDALEAARIDGAGWWNRLRYVILPELRGTMEFYVVVASITMLAWVFAYVYTITAGGPGTSSTVLELYIYNQGLRNSLPGMASAVAVVLLGVTLVSITLLFVVRARARVEDLA